MSHNDSFDAKTYGERISRLGLSKKAREIVEAEKHIPVQLERDFNIRIKVIDECGHACVFCHNEGTRVNQKQSKNRVSVFLPKSGGFEADRMIVEDSLIKEISRIRDYFGIREAHLTGGEPTQNTELPGIIRLLKKLGLKVKMTSNGETGGEIYEMLAEAGLDGVNISLLGSTPAEYADTQPKQFGISWAKFKLLQSKKAIVAAKSAGIEVKANCVMSSASDEQRVISLIKRSEEEGSSLRILNDLEKGEGSVVAIYNLLAKLGAKPERKKIVAGASTCSIYYRMPSGNLLGFKQIRRERLRGVCDGCGIDKAGECEEGYYGMRLYKDKANGKFMIGICIQRMDDFTMVADNFFLSEIPEEIVRQREAEYHTLTEKFLTSAK